MARHQRTWAIYFSTPTWVTWHRHPLPHSCRRLSQPLPLTQRIWYFTRPLMTHISCPHSIRCARREEEDKTGGETTPSGIVWVYRCVIIVMELPSSASLLELPLPWMAVVVVFFFFSGAFCFLPPFTYASAPSIHRSPAQCVVCNLPGRCWLRRRKWWMVEVKPTQEEEKVSNEKLNSPVMDQQKLKVGRTHIKSM